MSLRWRATIAAGLLLALLGQTVRTRQRMLAAGLLGAVRTQLGTAQGRQPLSPALVRGAFAAVERARALDPSAVEPRVYRGDLLLLVGRHRDAVAAYRAANAHEMRPEALLNAGHALWRLGERGAAIEQWRRAEALAPRSTLTVPVSRGELIAAPPPAAEGRP